MNPADMHPIADAFLQAALGHAPWESAMDAVAQASRSVGAVLLPFRGARTGAPFSSSLGEALETYFKAGWREHDVRDGVVPLIERRGIATELDFITPDEIAVHPYYQEFLRPFGLRWWAGVNVRAGDSVVCLALQRSIEAGPFVGEETALLAASAPKLSSAIAVAAALGNEKVQTSLVSFEACATPVMLFDRTGRISALNRSAEALLGQDLWLHQRRLVSWKRDVTIALGRALHVLSWDKDGPASETPIVIPRIKGRPIIAYPSRLPGVTNDYFTSVRMILILHDTASRPPTMPQVLAHAYGLSRAEARLAARIGRGEELKDIAEAEGITLETARARLKAVFAKTDTHRQAELAVLIAGLVR